MLAGDLSRFGLGQSICDVSGFRLGFEQGLLDEVFVNTGRNDIDWDFASTKKVRTN